MNSSLQSPEELSPQTFKYEEHSKKNHLNHVPRSQSSLESGSKAFKNFKKPQISETLWIKAFKVSKNFHHKPSKMKKNGFLTSLQLEIRCNFVSKIFDPFFSQIEGYLLFKSKSHYRNSNQQIFQGDRIKRSLFCNYRKLCHIFINTNSHL